jgi:hypothetical protein
MEAIMQVALNNVIKLSKSIEINYNQSLYLWSIKFDLNESVVISNTDMLKLVELGLVEFNKLTSVGHELLDIIIKDDVEQTNDVDITKALYPKLNRLSGEAVKELANNFLKNKLNKQEVSRILAYTKNIYQVPFIYIFLEMFPTSDADKNKDWNEHFDTEWDNVTLRKISRGTVKKFQAIWKSKDIGVFLVGTYLFIMSSRNDKTNKFFIKSIENYLKEYEHWYYLALDKLEKSERIKASDKIREINKSNTNIL